MPKRTDIHKVLIIGSGPIIIGQACEFDYSGTQACKALRNLGYEIVLVNSNPATIMTDPEMADKTYIEPLNEQVLTEIIARERPDALLPNLGGQTGLNLSSELAAHGVLEKYNVELIGVNIDAITRGEDRTAFKQTMERLNIEMPRSQTVNTVADAEKVAESLGYPVVIRPAYTMGGTGGGLVYNVEELQTIAARGLAASRVNQILVEESVLGWEELELEVVRDATNCMITVCFIENVDAMGVHTGDSICTAPMLTIAPELQARLQTYAYRIVEAIEVIGGTNIQFAHDPRTGRVVVIEINPRTSRSSALASKATGFPIAYISALLASGLTLAEIPYWREGTLDRYTPSGDYVVVKFPRWAFEKFEGVQDRLGTQMRAVGEVMSIGKTYKEALHKAIRSLESGRYGLGRARQFHNQPLETLLGELSHATSERQFILYEALRKGATVEQLAAKTHIKPWFLEQMRELVVLEETIGSYRDGALPDEVLIQAKRDGFADRYLADLLNTTEKAVRQQRQALGVTQRWETIPVSGVDDAAYYFSTYQPAVEGAPEQVSSQTSDLPLAGKIMVLGGGPNRIGQGIEFDYCCVHASLAIREAGYESIMVNCNPETVSTDYDTSHRLYFEPLTVEDVLSIYEKEQPQGVICQFGGQTPLNIAAQLAQEGVRIIGTSPDTIDLAEDRERFREIMRGLGIPQPEAAMAHTTEEAISVAAAIGYPLIVRPSYVLGGRAMEVVQDETMLRHYMAVATDVSPDRPILIDKFLENAIEAEADAICDGEEALVPAIMEHIELAGVHSGDSACVLPPISIPARLMATIEDYTRKIALQLGTVGLINIQYAIFENTVYILEANPRASRTVPVVSKAVNMSMARLATHVMLGKKLRDLHLQTGYRPYYAVKEAVFPFNMFPEVDPVLGPEMRSTGEVMGLADSFGLAFFKSQEAVQLSLPLSGCVLVTVADKDKTSVLEAVRIFRDLNFEVVSTRGTRAFLAEQGIAVREVRKLGYGRPDLVDAVKNGEIQLIINTPEGRQSQEDDSYIRKTAIRYKIPYITTTAGALAAARGIAERRTNQTQVRALQEYHQAVVCRGE